MAGILGLDISGSATGWAYYKDGAFVDYGKYITNQKHSRSERLFTFYSWLVGLLGKLTPEIVLIEKPFLGRNSKVLANLSKFVAAAEMATFYALNLSIEDTWLIDPREVKKTLKVKKPRGRQNPKKKHDDNKIIMVKRINELYGLKLKYKAGKSKKYCDDDIADALALVHTWNIRETNKNE